MTVHLVKQRSEEWHQLRVGKCTASRMADVTARTKSGWGASRSNYRAELIVERLTGAPYQQSFVSAAMQYGIENEAEAISAYEFRTDNLVEPVGFIEHPRIPMSGASPDGMVGLHGLIECKVPNSATHIDTLLSGTVPDKYVKQMQWQMACSGMGWCDYISYDPRMPEAMRLFVKRVPRADNDINLLEHAVAEFLAELDDRIDALRTKYALTGQLAASVAAA